MRISRSQRKRVSGRTREFTLQPLEGSLHSGLHTGLLNRLTNAGPVQAAAVDAVVVPTSRPVECLREAIHLANSLESMLIVLCSRSAAAAEATSVDADLRADMIAIDVGDLRSVVPTFLTSELLREPRFERFKRSSDLSAKRNLGLMLARLAGWRSVLFLDDDISDVNSTDVEAAAGLLAQHTAVGLRNSGFPDNSVVCHAYRAAGGKQGSFVGAGAMVVAPRSVRSFFPDIYNEDWLFLHRELKPRRVAELGHMFHKAFDPYADPRRAEDEEFGDCLAEGLYRLLDDGRSARAADAHFWQDFLYSRRRLIAWVLTRIREKEHRQRDQIIASLEAAQSVSPFITPRLCTDYVDAWMEDMAQWRRHLARLRTGLGVEKALAELGLADRCMYARRD